MMYLENKFLNCDFNYVHELSVRRSQLVQSACRPCILALTKRIDDGGCGGDKRPVKYPVVLSDVKASRVVASQD